MQFALDKKTYKDKLRSYKIKDKIKFHRYLVDLLEIDKTDKILDLGCGHGQTLLYIANKLNKGGRVIGLDNDDKLLAVAEKVLKDVILEKKIELVKFDISKNLPFSAESLNKIVCHNVIECIPDKAHFIDECYRVLKKSGILIVSHTDFDTQIYNSSFPELSRSLVHNYCDTQQEWMEVCDGMIGRKLFSILKKSKFKDIKSKVYVMSNTSYKPLEYGYRIAQDIINVAKKSKKFSRTELNEWLEDLKDKDKKGEFFYSSNTYIVIARK